MEPSTQKSIAKTGSRIEGMGWWLLLAGIIAGVYGIGVYGISAVEGVYEFSWVHVLPFAFLVIGAILIRTGSSSPGRSKNITYFEDED
jgi:hypothetical protein